MMFCCSVKYHLWRWVLLILTCFLRLDMLNTEPEPSLRSQDSTEIDRYINCQHNHQMTSFLNQTFLRRCIKLLSEVRWSSCKPVDLCSFYAPEAPHLTGPTMNITGWSVHSGGHCLLLFYRKGPFSRSSSPSIQEQGQVHGVEVSRMASAEEHRVSSSLMSCTLGNGKKRSLSC